MYRARPRFGRSLVAAALLFVLPPLLRRAPADPTGVGAQRLSLSVHREQLAELDAAIAGFAANLNLQTNGSKQVVQIDSKGEIRGVTITMTVITALFMAQGCDLRSMTKLEVPPDIKGTIAHGPEDVDREYTLAEVDFVVTEWRSYVDRNNGYLLAAVKDAEEAAQKAQEAQALKAAQDSELDKIVTAVIAKMKGK